MIFDINAGSVANYMRAWFAVEATPPIDVLKNLDRSSKNYTASFASTFRLRDQP
jgi:hypothetical protein